MAKTTTRRSTRRRPASKADRERIAHRDALRRSVERERTIQRLLYRLQQLTATNNNRLLEYAKKVCSDAGCYLAATRAATGTEG